MIRLSNKSRLGPINQARITKLGGFISTILRSLAMQLLAGKAAIPSWCSLATALQGLAWQLFARNSRNMLGNHCPDIGLPCQSMDSRIAEMLFNKHELAKLDQPMSLLAFPEALFACFLSRKRESKQIKLPEMQPKPWACHGLVRGICCSSHR